MIFEEPEKKKSPFVRFLPWGLLIAGAVAAGFLFLGNSPDQDSGELPGIIRSGDAGFDRYVQQLELKDVKIQMGLNFARKRVLMLSGILVNRSDRPVDVLEVKVILLNYETPILESFHLPIKPSPYTPPVEALAERAFSFYIEQFPEGWLNSHAEMHLNGFRFAAR